MVVQRLLSAAIAIPILLAAIWIGDPSNVPVFSAVLALVTVAAAWEFYGLAARAGHAPMRRFGVALALLFVGNAYVAALFGRDLTSPLLALAVVSSLALFLLRSEVRGAATDWGLTLAGALYTGGLLSYFVRLRYVDGGMGWVMVAVLATFAADTAAFFGGRHFGRTRLADRISPKKTVEGAISGLIASPLATMVLVTLLGLHSSLLFAAVVGLLIALAAEIGDLAESLLKRSLGAKDASQLIPGHGGFLDRIDSLVFAVVVVYYCVGLGL